MAHQRELCADLRKRITRTIVPMESHSQNRMSIRNHTGVQALEGLKVTAIGREPCSAPGLPRPSPGRTLQSGKDHSSGLQPDCKYFTQSHPPALVS
jgi:hypothetical protein